MTPDRAAVVGATALVVVATVLSGPIGVYGLSAPAGPPADAGNGSVSVRVVELPSEGVRFDERDGRVERYELVVPNARVDVEGVSGHPILLFELQIPELGYGQTGIYFLDEADGGRLTMVMPGDDLPGDLVEASSYEGFLLVKTRTTAGNTIVARQNVTVEVTA